MRFPFSGPLIYSYNPIKPTHCAYKSWCEVSENAKRSGPIINRYQISETGDFLNLIIKQFYCFSILNRNIRIIHFLYWYVINSALN